jgi:hypothetical protein
VDILGAFSSKALSLAFKKNASLLGTIKTNGGVGRDRTDDILLAKQALSQLSYDPKLF